MQILKLLLDVGILITVTKLLDVGSRKAAVWTSAALLVSRLISKGMAQSNAFVGFRDFVGSGWNYNRIVSRHIVLD